ncbi:LOW QUALITY PROTEIN: hypothetical protein V2J09_011274 [Rumex salicifolius]
MEKVSSFVVLLHALIIGAVLMAKATVDAAISLPKDTLTRQYYKKHNTCDDLEAVIKHQVWYYMQKDKSIAPKLARLLYSDCFVTGCDASILLAGEDSERKASQNIGLGGFAVIDKIKEVVEKRCPGVVSCADILNLATRDAIHLAGGPSYIIRTGRKDGFSSKASTVNLPLPSISVDELLKYFQSKGLDDFTPWERCRYIMDRLYNFNGSGKSDPSMDDTNLASLRAKCPKTKKKGEHEGIVAMNPDAGSEYALSNTTYTRIVNYKAVMGVDQQLMYNKDTMQLAQEFSDTLQDFKLALALSMARMSEIGVLNGSNGEIRRHCAYSNKDNPN